LKKGITWKITVEGATGFSHRTAMEEAGRCLLCHDAPCSGACPAGTDPGKFIRSIRFRNVKGAAETIRQSNVLGGTCANVCPASRLCEDACSRCGIDRPIEIAKLQCYAVEQEKALKMKILRPPAKKNLEQVACIGAGPASLACAAELAKAGYRVTVFEQNARAGGVLTYGIPTARLPQKIIETDLSSVKGLGVKFEYGKEIGSKITVSDLTEKKGFSAVFIGVGLGLAKLPDIPGVNLRNVVTGMDFLRTVREKGGYDKLEGKNVIVIGGGDVAVDCAIVAKETGAANVAIWYRRTIEEAPAEIGEILLAVSRGVSFSANYAPKQINGKTKAESVEFIGRDNKSTARALTDLVIFAIGQKPDDLKEMAGVETDEAGLILTDEHGQTSQPGIFAAGDVVHGGKTVVEAVAAGKVVADGIIKYFEGRK
jgi:dihydropyrimidine dehydrogenase (NAD+) subunit PreT